MPYNNFKCEWIDKQEIYKRADEMRTKYWQNDLPVNLEQVIEFGLNLNIEPMHGLFTMIDMDAWLRIDLTGIVVDYDCFVNDKFVNRLRFSFAHEIGHYFLHSDIYSNLVFNSIEEWKDFIINVSETEYGYFERQANEFAGRFLVPLDLLEIQVNEAAEIIKQNNLVEYLRKDPDAVLSGVAPFLKKPFAVSDQVIKIRVQNEEL